MINLEKNNVYVNRLNRLIDKHFDNINPKYDNVNPFYLKKNHLRIFVDLWTLRFMLLMVFINQQRSSGAPPSERLKAMPLESSRTTSKGLELPGRADFFDRKPVIPRL